MKQDSIIYYNKKGKNPVISFISYLRDCIFYFLPFTILPRWIIRLFYGKVTYVFFIHPRRSEDWYLGLPFLALLRRIFKKERLLDIVSKMPPGIVSSIEKGKSRGVVLSSLALPETLIKNRKSAINQAIGAIKFSKMISEGKCIVGLGAWWPIITRRGEILQKNAQSEGVVITNGHTGTLLSIFLMIENIAKISGFKVNDFKIVIIGAGKMGTNVARILNGEVKALSLVDINEINLEKVFRDLRGKTTEHPTKISTYVRSAGNSMHQLLNEHHMGICVTSNANIVIKPEEVPDYFITIDDSRPEAISRKIVPDKKMIIEGGLMKIAGVRTNYDYGFGIDQNVFGCLAEAYALSIDEKGILRPTIGDVDLDDFKNMKEFCQNNGIEVGDFKSSGKIIDNGKIRLFMRKRNEIINRSE